MTNAELAQLPVGTKVRLGESCGEIIQAGRECKIRWEDAVSIIMTDSQNWQSLVQWIERDEELETSEFD
jgi:hypothetical protein